MRKLRARAANGEVFEFEWDRPEKPTPDDLRRIYEEKKAPETAAPPISPAPDALAVQDDPEAQTFREALNATKETLTAPLNASDALAAYPMLGTAAVAAKRVWPLVKWATRPIKPVQEYLNEKAREIQNRQDPGAPYSPLEHLGYGLADVAGTVTPPGIVLAPNNLRAHFSDDSTSRGVRGAHRGMTAGLVSGAGSLVTPADVATAGLAKYGGRGVRLAGHALDATAGTGDILEGAREGNVAKAGAGAARVAMNLVGAKGAADLPTSVASSPTKPVRTSAGNVLTTLHDVAKDQIKGWIRERQAAPYEAAITAHKGSFAALKELTPQFKPSKEIAEAAARSLEAKGLDPTSPEFAEALPKAINDLQLVSEFQQGVNRPEFAPLKALFEQLRQESAQVGIEVARKKNYLPQLWVQDPHKVSIAYKRLGLKPKFTMESIIRDYAAGIKAGLTPRFTNINDMLEWYIKTARTGQADRKLWDLLKGTGLVVPELKAKQQGRRYEVLDPNISPFYGYRDKATGKETRMNYAIDPELRAIMENYLKEGKQSVLDPIVRTNSVAKNLRLAAGIQGINTQTIKASMANALTAGPVIPFEFKGGKPKFNPGFWREAGIDLRYMLQPRKAQEYIKAELTSLPDFVRSGGTASAEHHVFRGSDKPVFSWFDPNSWKDLRTRIRSGKNPLEKVEAFSNVMFEDPTYQAVLPALKLRYWKRATAEMVKAGVPLDGAKEKAAEQANNFFGGLNYDTLFRDKTTLKLIRAMLLAPDHYESQGRLAKGMGEALLDPSNPLGRQYITAMKNMVTIMGLANLGQYALSGRTTATNGPGKELSLYMGTDEKGREVTQPIFGNFTDFARIPGGIIRSIIERGDLSRISSDVRARFAGPTGAALTTAFGYDWRGRKILGDEIPIEKQVGNVARVVSDAYAPQWASSPIEGLTGSSTPLEALTQSLEMGTRFSRPLREDRDFMYGKSGSRHRRRRR